MESSTHPQPTLTLQALSRRSVLMLFAAMAVALVTGLLAWGPVMLTVDARHHADARIVSSIAHFTQLLSGVALLLAGLWGSKAVRRSCWTLPVQRPWSWFFAAASLWGAIGCLYSMTSSNAGFVCQHVAAASAFSLMLLAFLAERVDARFGSVKACLGSIVAASVAACAWWLETTSHGAGDLRAVLLLEILPVLLVPAGALDLRGRHTKAPDWVLLLCLCAVAAVCDPADAAMLEWSRWIGGHTLMQLGIAAGTAWIALRCAQAGRTDQGFGSFGDSSQRKTSLNTSF